jgi:hypothetical protein
MLNWPAKDPDATYDYRWEPPLDEGDKLASGTITRTSGDVVIESQAMDDTGFTVVLSGGSVGFNSFKGVWNSVGGRGDDEDIAIEVREKSADPLLTAFRIRYPAFAAVDAGTIVYWLKDADRFVNDGWGEDADPARLAYAAHHMSLNGTPGIAAGATSQIPAGVTKFKSASLDVSISDAAANRSIRGGWSATIYGQDFAVMLRRNTGSPRLVGYVEPMCRYGG